MAVSAVIGLFGRGSSSYMGLVLGSLCWTCPKFKADSEIKWNGWKERGNGRQGWLLLLLFSFSFNSPVIARWVFFLLVRFWVVIDNNLCQMTARCLPMSLFLLCHACVPFWTITPQHYFVCRIANSSSRTVVLYAHWNRQKHYKDDHHFIWLQL